MRLLIVLGVSLGLLACNGDDATDEPEQRGYDAIAYELVGAFDWTTQQLTAHETITLDVTPGQRSIVLDTTVAIDGIAGADGAALHYDHDRSAGRLTVDLGSSGGGLTKLTVDYHAAASATLIASSGRDDDPVTSRVVFTDSEPDRGGGWLVAHHHPSDRATWAVELTVPADEDVIANGARTRDDQVGGSRVIRYELDKPIPTYLMAFAAGQLDHVDRPGPTPLSVWYRRGLLIDAERNLDLLAELIPRFEALIGPYPWPSYSVVLMPAPFSGGMENATITFNAESTGQGDLNLSIEAHELGHQWFGDWVTMHDYPDVWFKEGMATVLATEGARGRRGGATARKFGLDFNFNASDSIVDLGLHGLDRYTSGPYERAAWLITQIRARVGDDAFWASLRAMLADNALGTLTGPRFIQGFAPALGATEIDQLIATLELKDTPALGISVAAAGGDQAVTFSLSDSHHQLLAPFDVTVVDAAGAATSQQVSPGTPRTVTVPAGGYLAPDEIELNPPWMISSQASGPSVAALYAPSAPAALAAFNERSAGHQERALFYAVLPPFAPAELPAFYAGLDSTLARRYAEIRVCDMIGSLNPAGRIDWVAQLPVFLATPGVESFSARYAGCGLASPETTAELASVIDTVTPVLAPRLSFLISFDYGAETSFAQLSKLAATAPSLQLREQALSRLASHIKGGYSAIPDLAPWKALFEDRLSRAGSAARFNIVWRAVIDLADKDALPIAGSRLRLFGLSQSRQQQVVCDAYALTLGDAAWVAFQTAAQPWDTLSPNAQAVLKDPGSCQTAARRTSPEPRRAKPL